MSHLQTRAQHTATLRHMDALNRDAEYAKAEAARDWDFHNRCNMLAAEIGVFNHVFGIPERGACLDDADQRHARIAEHVGVIQGMGRVA